MRPDLPSGTVTFVFTDVEGSTRLLHELGAEGYAEALAEHRRVIREACDAQGGVEVDTQGDAFFFAFPTAPAALDAALAFTAALRSGPVRVRVGLHTGSPLLTDEGYVGGDVHRAARIAAAGHGGQVLVSSSTASLVDARLVDLGEHRFKDLAAAERVFQAGEGEFPPLASLYRSNLPIPANALVGREQEVLDVTRLLTEDGARLVTVTGPGGVGKTRFAVAVAGEVSDAFAEGTWFVSLAPLSDPTLVLPGIAVAVGADEDLVGHFGAGEALVVLDNLEHLIEVAPELADLLARCPGLRLLVTSRESLRVAPEREYPLPPLAERPAVELFRQRVAAAAPGSEIGYDEAAAICERLDGLPLAIELTAARSKALSPRQILERLTARLDLLQGGRDSDPRQRTLRATLDWSYELLEPVERELFGALAVFAGGCTLAAAEEVCGADLDVLQSLVEKSLLRYSSERYWMLETIRELAEEKLEAGESAARLRRRHAEHFLELGRSLGLTMESLERTRAQRHQVAIQEASNFRAALDWAGEHDLGLAVEIAFSLENFWVTQDPQEGVRRFSEFLERENELPLELRAAAYRCLGNVTIFAGDRSAGVDCYEAALALYREAGNEIGEVVMEHRAAINRAPGDLEARRATLEQLLVRFGELGLATGQVQVLGSLAGVEHRLGELEQAVEHYRAATDWAADIGFSWWELGARISLAWLYLELDRDDDARAETLQALELVRRTGNRSSELSALSLLVRHTVRAGESERAGVLWGAIEAEGARRRGLWTAESRDAIARDLPIGDADFERGRERGGLMSLDEALELVRASLD